MSTKNVSNSGQPGQRPDQPWANGFLSENQRQRFISLVHQMALDRWGCDVRFDPHRGLASLADGSVINLENLARELVLQDENEWRSVIYQALADWGSISPERITEMLACWPRVQPLLRLRRYAGDVGQELAERCVDGDLRFALAVNVGVGVSPIPSEVAASWPISIDRAWQVAEANSRAAPLPAVDLVSDGEDRFVLLRGDLLCTGIAMDLSRLIPPEPEQALLVSTPTSNMVLISTASSDGSTAFQRFTDFLYSTERHPLSPRIFRYFGPSKLGPNDESGA